VFGKKSVIASIVVGLAMLVSLCTWGGGVTSPPQEFVPSHADAAIFFAKYYGLFDGYVPKNASQDQCVSFLNDRGIYFGLLEVFEKVEFTLGDCARVMGQLSLVFSGEAEYEAGKVKLPNGFASWEVFCQLNYVKYDQGYADLSGVLRKLYNLFLID
jgi:hypothetical protein